MVLIMAIHKPLLGVLNGCRNVINYRITPVLIYYQQNAGLKSETREKLKILNLPEKPKKPLTAYFIYLSEHRQEVVKKNPNLKMTEIIKHLGIKWRNIDESEKEKYSKDYKAQLSEYHNKLEEYKKKLTDEQKEFLEDLSKEKHEDRIKRQLRKKYKESNKPKRSLNPYTIFLLEKSKKDNIPFNTVMRTGKDSWNMLSSQEKQKYKDLSDSDKVAYETELAKWEMRMIREGKVDLIKPHREESTHIKSPKKVKGE